jgi:hypothetical protein
MRALTPISRREKRTFLRFSRLSLRPSPLTFRLKLHPQRRLSFPRGRFWRLEEHSVQHHKLDRWQKRQSSYPLCFFICFCRDFLVVDCSSGFPCRIVPGCWICVHFTRYCVPRKTRYQVLSLPREMCVAKCDVFAAQGA